MTQDVDKSKGEEEKKVEEKDSKSEKETDDDLSEEDKQLQEQLNLCVERLQEDDSSLYKLSLDTLCSLIRSSTTSMTSVPKPLKFLLVHYDTLKGIHEKIEDSLNKRLCADIISVLAMTMVDVEQSKRDTLNYRFLGSHEPIGAWGHEYVRHLTGQVAAEWEDRGLSADGTTEEAMDVDSEQPAATPQDQYSFKEKLLNLVEEIVPYHISHNAEAEAIDLCIEIGRLDLLRKHTSESNYQRVCLYLTSCVAYLPDDDWTSVLDCARLLYLSFHDHGNTMRCALKLNRTDLAAELFTSVKDSAERKQLAFLMGRHQYVIDWDPESCEDGEDLTELMANARLNEYFVALGRELDIMEPKLPEDVYKSHLEPNRPGLGGNVDSARQNLASSYVNGLVNCGYGKDKLLMDDADGKMKWIYKNKDVGMMSTVASLGWLLLWDVDAGLSQIDKYLYSSEDFIKAGGLLACGVVNSGVKNECDPAFALLAEYVENKVCCLSRAAIIGLGVAYAGSGKTEVLETLLPMVTADDKVDAPCLAALSCGMVTVGSLNDDVTSTILQTMLERPAAQWDNSCAKLMALGLGLTCLGRQEDAEVILASLEAVQEPMRSMAHLLVDVCAYAGTGNVLKVQHLLHILSEKYEGPEEKTEDDKKDDKNKKNDKKDDKNKKTTEEKMNVDLDATEETEEEDGTGKFAYIQHQGLAALGVAVIAMGEDVGTDMAFRMFGHLLRFGEGPIKRAVPLALALCYASNPQLKVLDTLSKFSHDSDQELSYNAILAMGVVGAGTNNARLAAMLRQLAIYHAKDPYNLFMVRLAQGLTHLGKGTMTLSPFHSDRFLLAPTAVAGLLAVLVSSLDVKKTLLGRLDYLLFYLTPAIQPRLLMTFDAELQPLPVSVRVGQAVDVVGQAGRPKTITGFQTHTTPVLLAHGERSELATEEYLPVTQAPLEGFVILKKNPDYMADG